MNRNPYLIVTLFFAVSLTLFGCYQSISLEDSSTGDIDSDSDADTESDTDSDTDTDTEEFFITIWEIDKLGTPGEKQIKLPLVSNGEYNFTVDWGDGTQDTIQSYSDAAARHYYDVGGYFEVRISGLIKGWAFNCVGADKKLVEIANWGSFGFGETTRQFAGCNNLIITATDVPDLTDTTSLDGAFGGCNAITQIPSIEDWDVSGVTDMSYMFTYTELFNQDLSAWDVSNVTDMSYMFDKADSFNQDLSAWDVSNVTDMSLMFFSAKSFEQDISAWNISSVTNMNYMFHYAYLSTANYDAILIGWENQEVQDDVVFDGGHWTTYSPGAAAEARARLISEHGWTIWDGGEVE